MSEIIDIQFDIPGGIVPWGRAGGNGSMRFTPAKVRNYQAVIRQYAADAMGDRPLIDGPCILDINGRWPWPKSISQKKRLLIPNGYKKSVPDSDNLCKVLMDAMNKIVWTDDARVAVLHVTKKYSDKPGVHVLIREIV